MSKIAYTIYLLMGFVSIGLGATYLLSPTFMPYHAVAVGQPWSEVQREYQVLIGALLDVAGAGWICVGIVLLALVAIPLREAQRWARILAPAIILIFYIPTLLATLAVLNNTAATPPWYGPAFACTLTVLAIILDRPWQEKPH